MTSSPSETPDNLPASSDVQHVVAMRAEPEAAEDPLVAFASRTTTVLGSAAGTFFTTIKRMLLLGVILALGAAWWAEQGSVLRGVAAALLVFIPATVVAVLLSGQRAAAAIAGETWRQSGLVRHVMNFLLDRVVAGTDSPAAATGTSGETALGNPVSDAPASAAVIPGTRIPLGEACSRLIRAVRRWQEASSGSSRLIARSQQWIGGIVERLTLTEFQGQLGQGGVDVEQARAALSGRIDDAVAGQLRRKTRSATAGAILAVLVWAVLVAYFLGRLGAGQQGG